MGIGRIEILGFIEKHRFLFGALLGSLLLLSHLPFIDADPDVELSSNRGPWTDQGLYTGQIRNYVQADDLAIESSPCLVSAPLFQVSLLVPLKTFGSSWRTAKLTLLFIILSILLILIHYHRRFSLGLLLFLMIALSQFRIFHFSHLALTEVLASIFILSSILFFERQLFKNRTDFKSVLMVVLVLYCASLIKIQYVYILALFPVFLFIWWIMVGLKEAKDSPIPKGLLSNLILSLVILLIASYLIRYLPFSDVFMQNANTETGRAFMSIDGLNFKGIIAELFLRFNSHILNFKSYPVYTTLFCIAIILGLFQIFKSNSNSRFRVVFLLSLLWFVLEMHKLIFYELPPRYLVSLNFCMGFIISIVIQESISLKQLKLQYKFISIALILFIVTLLYVNIQGIAASFDRRTFNIRDANAYLRNVDFQERPILGTWSQSLAWESDALTLPTWKGYFNSENMITNLNPRLIITEQDQRESGEAFKSDGIIFKDIADSIVYKTIGSWDLQFVWIP